MLAGASSVHTVRWANGLSASGHEVHVISQHSVVDFFIEPVNFHIFPFRGAVGYFTMAPAVKRLVDKINPDIVNVHYASGYGTTARLVNYHPYVLSVWGSDVYDFPHKSLLHKFLVRKNILAADKVASTSHCMANQTASLAPSINNISITPFGVDLSKYNDIKPKAYSKNKKIVIGTVKSMSSKYGIDTLIEAYAILVNKLKACSQSCLPELELRLVGDGNQVIELKSLAERLGVSDTVSFIGRVPHTEVPNMLGEFDIFVALSRLDSESFGVAVIEAGAAGLPVVVSDAGGLPEVTVDNKTGFVVPKENPVAAAEKMERLVLDHELRIKMGEAAKRHVSVNYAWDECINIMLEVYEEAISISNNASI